MFKILDQTKEDVIALRIKDRIERKDYEKLTPILDKTSREHKSLKLYIEMDSIKGVQPKALWDDVVTYLKYKNEIEKVAVVADKDWYKPVTRLTNPFVKGEVKYFPESENIEAQKWIMN